MVVSFNHHSSRLAIHSHWGSKRRALVRISPALNPSWFGALPAQESRVFACLQDTT
jgi:hypothetical protein